MNEQNENNQIKELGLEKIVQSESRKPRNNFLEKISYVAIFTIDAANQNMLPIPISKGTIDHFFNKSTIDNYFNIFYSTLIKVPDHISNAVNYCKQFIS